MLFPSPCGVNIVANLAISIYQILKNGFPSPCGVNIVANQVNEALFGRKHFNGDVSVPLRGKYRGESISLCLSAMLTRFPSPCGVNIVANMAAGAVVMTFVVAVSVPLRGKYRGESEPIVKMAFYLIGFRPLAG